MSFVAFAFLSFFVEASDRRFLFFNPPDKKILITLQDVATEQPFDRDSPLGSITVHEGSGHVLREVQIANLEWISDFTPDLSIDLARGTRLVLTNIKVVPELRVVSPEVLLRFYLKDAIEGATHLADRPLTDLVEQIDRRLQDHIFWRGERFSYVKMEDQLIDRRFRLLPGLPRETTYEAMMACSGSLR